MRGIYIIYIERAEQGGHVSIATHERMMMIGRQVERERERERERESTGDGEEAVSYLCMRHPSINYQQ